MIDITRKTTELSPRHRVRRASVVTVAAGAASMTGFAFAAPAFTQTTNTHVRPVLASMQSVLQQTRAVPALTHPANAPIAHQALHHNAVRALAAPHQLPNQMVELTGLKLDGMPRPEWRHQVAEHEVRRNHHEHCDGRSEHHECTCHGKPGPQGPKGAMGLSGRPGPQGVMGSMGFQGAQGTSGTNGAQGAVGTQGTAGTNGAQGAVGAQGTAGAQGAQGSQGASGDVIALAHHGAESIRVTIQGSTGKTFITLPSVGSGAARDLSGLTGYYAPLPGSGPIDVSESVHAGGSGDTVTLNAVNAAGVAKELICRLNGASGLDNPGVTAATACAPGWQAITFP